MSVAQLAELNADNDDVNSVARLWEYEVGVLSLLEIIRWNHGTCLK